MKKYLLLSILLLVLGVTFTSAQECTREILMQKPGTWKAGLKGSVTNVNAADLAKEKMVTAGIHKLISSRYSPTGCQVLYSSAFGKTTITRQAWIADPYYYSMYILRYLCDAQSKDKSKYYVDYATPTTVNISANAIYSMNNLYAAGIATDDFRGYLKLKQRPEKKNGFYFMGEEIVGDRGMPSEIKEYRWLITYNDTLPFLYLTRKEYLLIQMKRLEKSIKENPGEKEYTTKFLNNVKAFLQKPEAELSQPAIGMWNDEERFERFVEEGTRGSFIAVKPNLDYYHKKLPLSTPQFFSVVYKISAGDPVFKENITNIEKAVDFAVLKSMLGK